MILGVTSRPGHTHRGNACQTGDHLCIRQHLLFDLHIRQILQGGVSTGVYLHIKAVIYAGRQLRAGEALVRHIRASELLTHPGPVGT